MSNKFHLYQKCFLNLNLILTKEKINYNIFLTLEKLLEKSIEMH